MKLEKNTTADVLRSWVCSLKLGKRSLLHWGTTPKAAATVLDSTMRQPEKIVGHFGLKFRTIRTNRHVKSF